MRRTLLASGIYAGLNVMSQQAAHDNPSGVPAAQPEQVRLTRRAAILTRYPCLTRAQAVQVVQYLLAHNYLLTALELLVEAQEAGNEEDVDSLQHFFSDQAKFPAEVVAKYDPNDGTTACLHNSAETCNAGSRFLLACNCLY